MSSVSSSSPSHPAVQSPRIKKDSSLKKRTFSQCFAASPPPKKEGPKLKFTPSRPILLEGTFKPGNKPPLQGGQGTVLFGTISGFPVALKSGTSVSYEIGVASKMVSRHAITMSPDENGSAIMPKARGDLSKYLSNLSSFFYDGKYGDDLKIALLINFCTQILKGLKDCNVQAQVAHCDLKPGNILILNESRNTFVVSDFGSAVGNNCEKIAITPCYAAPELLSNDVKFILDIDEEKFGPGADIWSLGVIIYQMVFGEMYYQYNSTPQK